MPDGTLRRAIRELLGLRPTPTQRRRLALDLRAAAEQQEAIADAEDLERQRAPAERLAPKDRRGQGRKPSRFVRIERVVRPMPAGRSEDRDIERSTAIRARQHPKLCVHVGRELYYALGSPARLAVAVERGVLRMRPAGADEGFALIVGSGMPKMWCSGIRGALAPFPDGRYSATIADGAIVVGSPLEG